MKRRAKGLTDAELDVLAEKIHCLPAPERLRLAAGLLEKDLPTAALPIIHDVAMDLALVLMRGGR